MRFIDAGNNEKSLRESERNSKFWEAQAERVLIFSVKFSRESMTGPCSNESYIKDNIV
ncbi:MULTISPECIES: hypothetical protein [Methanosarcina]|uniref:hypothetical protein n=1 Tax=Methanosarcina TaxID=2207 RepID=UPI000A59AAA9|nr:MULTISPECIES: hypothetical protein [Methanosarcina]